MTEPRDTGPASLTELEARFRTPVPLGSELAFGLNAGLDAGHSPDAGRFTVTREGRIAVGGRFAFAPPDSV